MDAEKELELEWWPVLHPCLNTEDDDEVRNEGRENLMRRRHWRLSGHIVSPLVRNAEGPQREGSKQEIRERGHEGRGRRGEELPTLYRRLFSQTGACSHVRHHPASLTPIHRK